MSERKVTRRQCLGALAATAVASAGGYVLWDRSGDRKTGQQRHPIKDYFAGIEFPASNPRISAALGDDRGIDAMVRAAVNGLDAGLGIKRFVHPGDVVLIKPNAGFDRPPHLGATTHPEVVRAVIRLCKEAGARQVMVTDHPIETPEACWIRSEIGPVAHSEGATLLTPRDREFVGLTGPAELLKGWPVFVAPLHRADKLIGIAPVKDHNLCGASMNLKNWYGLLGGRRNQLHQAIHEVISDLAAIFSPTLVIADATRVMMTSGPTGGRATDVQPGGQLGRPAVIAAVDPVACDAWCYENLLGRDPATLAYLSLAARKLASLGRLGESNWRAYEVSGQIVTTSV